MANMELLYKGLERYKIPYPYNYRFSNEWIRWGRSNQFWAKELINENGWSFGDFTRNISESIFDNNNLTYNKESIIKEKEKRKSTEEKRQKEAAKKAYDICRNSPVAELSHPHLKSKGIRKINSDMRMGFSDSLIIPLFNINHEITSLQFTYPDGKKLFLSGGVKKGSFYPINRLTDKSKIFIGEGFATTSSLCSILEKNDSTYGFVASFDSGNILPVTKAIREKFPDVSIILGADNDCESDYNTGIDSARKVAREISNVRLLFPQWIDKQGSKIDQSVDWNDISVHFDNDEMIANKIHHCLSNDIEQVDFANHCRSIGETIKNIRRI